MSMILANPVRTALAAIFLLLLGICLWQTARIEGFKLWPIEIAGLEEQLADEKAARAADRARYEAAQERARIDNETHVKQIEEQHERITDRISGDYARDLQRLRDQAKANRGPSGSAPVSGVPKATGGADADGVQSPSCDNLCASEIELRLMHLQNWVREQMGVSR